MTECTGNISSLSHAEKDRLIEQLRQQNSDLERKLKELKNSKMTSSTRSIKSNTIADNKSHDIAKKILNSQKIGS